MRARWFLILVAGFTSGIALRSFIDLGTAFILFLFLVATVLLLFFAVRRVREVFFVSLFIFSGALGVLRFDVSQIEHGDPILDGFVGKSISARGVVAEEPDERNDHTNIIVALKEISLPDGIRPLTTRAIIIAEPYPTWRYGDEVSISGKILLPKNFENSDTGRSFDYVSYLAKDGIHYQFIRPQISLIDERKGNFIKEKLFALKHAFLARVSRVIPEPESSLLGGLLVGAKQSLGEKLLNDFRVAGVIHIVVLSGYNLTIVAEAIMRFFSFAPRLWGLSLGGFSIILFSIMTGGGATVVRASLMALLALVARATGRIYEITLALLLAGFIMLLYNPHVLIFDPSFQLSFLATLGLINLSPILEKRLVFLPKRFGIREIASATLSTQLFVLPLLLYMTGTFSILSLPANLLILPFIPLTMLFGFLTGAFGFISVAFSFPFALMAHLLLFYELKVVEVTASIPFASIGGFLFPASLMLAWYMVYGGLLFFYARREKADHT